MRTHRLSLLASAFSLLAAPHVALAQQTTTTATDTKEEGAASKEDTGYIDLAGSLGFSTNPFLSEDAQSSIFARGSALAVYQFNSERHVTDLSAYAEGSYYLKQKDSTKLGRLDIRHRYQASETTSLFGGVGVSVDYGSQLSNRFLTLPQPQPGAPDVIVDPSLFGQNRKSYRLDGNVGVSFKVSERDSMTLVASDQKVWYGNDGNNTVIGNDFDFNTISFGADWSRQLSERSSFGAHLGADLSDYDDPSLGTKVVTLQGTVSRLLSEDWEAKLSAGASYVIRKSLVGADDKSISPALNAELCRILSTESICAHASYGVSTAVREALKTAEIGATYSKRVNEKDNWHAGFSLSRYTGGVLTPTSTYVSAAAGYNRRFSDRLSGSVDLSGRDVFRKGGSNPPIDATGVVSLHYRLGDLQR